MKQAPEWLENVAKKAQNHDVDVAFYSCARAHPRRLMFKPRISLAACLSALIAFVTHAQPQTDPRQQLIGAWRLVSWTDHLVEGGTRPNARTVGSLMYSDANRMCAIIMDPSRPKWSDDGSPTGPEAVSAIRGLTAYCGTYEVNAAEGFVVHHVDVESRPNRVGAERKRFFSSDGNDRLSLRVDPSELPGVKSSTLIWERVEAAPAR